jgi:hypothetical protein
MTTTPSTGLSEVFKFAQEYQHNPNQHVVLEPLKDAILLLRAKYATYDTITETLNKNGIKVSEASVRRFCRTHYNEIKRLQSETNRKRRESIASTDTATRPAGSSETPPTGGEKRPQLSDMGKPGPKIAREDL